MSIRELTVRREEGARTLQDFICARLELSRNRAKALIDARGVVVNGRRVWMARHALRYNDRVQILPGAAGGPAPAARAAVLHEDGDYLIVDKPAGLLSNGPDSIEQRLREQRGEPGLHAAHRLDRDTSGCLVLARTPEAFEQLVELFRGHGVSKTYHAVVLGRLATEGQTLSTEIDGQPAVTRLRTLDSNAKASHIVARIDTGRTHQIRRHLLGIRHPVLGDRQYGFDLRGQDASLVPGRQMLHAYEIGFRHPATEASVRAKAPLPADFMRCLRALKLT